MSVQTESVKPPPSGAPDSPRRPQAPDPPPRGSVPPSQAFHEAMSKLAELKEFVAYYAAVRIDMLKVTVRNVGIYAGLGVIGLLAAGAMVVTAVVLLLRGIAGAFAQLFSGYPWLGDLITAVLSRQPVYSSDPLSGALGERLAQNTPTGPIKVPLVIAQGDTKAPAATPSPAPAGPPTTVAPAEKSALSIPACSVKYLLTQAGPLAQHDHLGDELYRQGRAADSPHLFSKIFGDIHPSLN